MAVVTGMVITSGWITYSRECYAMAREFANTARALAGKVNIINSSRQTALKCFRRLGLNEALREVAC
jgi:hypothetical protein